MIRMLIATIMLYCTLVLAKTGVKDTGSCLHTNSSFNCVHYLDNYDGDTIRVSIPMTHPILGDKINIRLAGVDTPEIRSKSNCEKDLAKKARHFVKSRLGSAKSIRLENIARGKYFRIVADVIYDGNNLAQELKEASLAVSYDGGTKAKTNWCAVAQSLVAK